MAVSTSINGGGSLGMYDGSTLQLLGVNTGYDTKSLLDMELQAFQAKNTPILNQQNKYKTQKTIWTNYQSLIANLKSTIESLKGANSSNKTTAMDQTGYANVTASGSVPAGTHTLSIGQIATRSKIMGDLISNPYQALGYNTTVQINGKNLNLTRSMTATDIVSAINSNTQYKASAVIVSGRLMITSLDTGAANQLSFTDGAGTIVRAVSSDRSIMQSVITNDAAIVPGTYSMDVSQLAQKHTVASSAIADTNIGLGYSGTLTVNGVAINVVGSDGAKALSNKINQATGANVKATISGGQLLLESTVIGAAGALSITDSTTKSGASDSLFQSIGVLDVTNNFNNVTKAAQDALYTVNGVAQSSNDNIDRTIGGVETNLLQTTSSAATITVSSAVGNALQDMGILKADGTIKNVIDVGVDALYNVDGLNLQSASNTITDAINGVTFDLIKTTTSTVNLTFAQDNVDLQAKIKNFVTTYNDAIVKMNKLLGKDGELQGQNLPNQIKNALQRAIFGESTTGSSLKLYQLGIEIDGTSKDGALKLNETKLASMLKTNPTDAAKLFEGETSISGAMFKILDKATKTEGSFSTKMAGIQKTIDSIQKTLDRNDDQYKQVQQSLLLKYAKFDVAMSSLNAMNDQMTALLKGLSSSDNNN